MIRSLILLISVVALSLGGTAAVAWAEPAQPAEPAESPCTYTLSPPHVVDVSGTSMVTATLSPAACDQSNVFLSVACVQLQGSDGPGKCEQNNGILTAQVFYAPYRPGATYVSTGRGCASKGSPVQPFCQPIGPVTATL
jgi:hypothetical protein